MEEFGIACNRIVTGASIATLTRVVYGNKSMCIGMHQFSANSECND